MPELKRNILNSGYRVNFKYEGINEIGLILPTFPKDKRPKKGAILASVLGGIASIIIGLAYEGVSSFLHHMELKALNKAVKGMESKTDLQCNKIHHLEDTMIMYGVYNSDTLTDLIDTVYRMHNTSTWKERTFVEKLIQWLELYLYQDGIGHYAMKEKYVKMYERFPEQLKMYSKVIRILSKGYLPKTLLPPSKLERILNEVKMALSKTNKDYDLVLTHLYLCYDMKLATFGIDKKRNLIIQFPVFVQPYTQSRFVMYQIETVPIPILDRNDQAKVIYTVKNQ